MTEKHGVKSACPIHFKLAIRCASRCPHHGPNSFSPARRVGLGRERPDFLRATGAGADPHPVSIACDVHVAARPRCYLEADFLVFVNENRLSGDDDGCAAVLPSSVAPANVVRVAKVEIVAAADNSLGCELLLRRWGKLTRRWVARNRQKNQERTNRSATDDRRPMSNDPTTETR